MISYENKTLIKPLRSLRRPTFPTSILLQIVVCLQRGVLRLRNNYVPAVASVVANTILAIVVGSVYYNLPDTTDSMDQRAILIFFSLMITAFAPAFEVSNERHAFSGTTGTEASMDRFLQCGRNVPLSRSIIDMHSTTPSPKHCHLFCAICQPNSPRQLCSTSPCTS